MPPQKPWHQRARYTRVKDKLRRTQRTIRNVNNRVENMEDVSDAFYYPDAQEIMNDFNNPNFETFEEQNYEETFREIPDAKKFYPDSPFTTFEALSKLNGIFL